MKSLEDNAAWELDWGNRFSFQVGGRRVTLWLIARLSRKKFFFVLENEGPLSIKEFLNKLFEGISGLRIPEIPGPWGEILSRDIDLELIVSPSEGERRLKGSLTYSEPVEIGFLPGLPPILTVYGVVIYIGGEKGFDFSADIQIIGQERQIVEYPLPEPAPPTPPLVQFNYMALGQRLAVNTDSRNPSIPDALAKLKTDLSPSNPKEFAEAFDQYYSGDAGWVAALDLEIRDFLTLQAIFSDPTLYGLAVSFSEKMRLQGLKFQILYSKVNDDIGMFYVDLTLPDAIRQFDVGALSVTLPSVDITIFTNGDFRVGIGWPLGERSMTVQALTLPVPLLGGGGLYFAKLSGATAPDMPPPPPGKAWAPVLAFGIALRLGVGREIKKGILTASISVSLTGIFEGRIAWERDAAELSMGSVPLLGTGDSANPGRGLALSRQNSMEASKTPSYFWFRGTFGIVAVIQGAVDFSIVKASLTVQLEAWVTVTFETGRDIPITVGGSISVALRVEVGGFKIFGKRVAVYVNLRFKAEISETFVIAGAQSSVASLQAAREVQPLRWSALPAGLSARSEPVAVRLFFAPQLTVVDHCATFIAGLSIPISDFEQLARKVAEFLLMLHSADGHGTVADAEVRWSHADLKLLGARLSACRWLNGRAVSDDPLTYERIIENLTRLQVKLVVAGSPLGDEPEDAAVFPMIPDLELAVDGVSEPFEVDFMTKSPRPESFLRDLGEYVDELLLSFDPAEDPGARIAEGSDEPSMAKLVFEDYFGQIFKEVQDQMLRAVEERDGPGLGREEASWTLGELLDGIDYEDLAGKVSRFAQQGLRIPDGREIPADRRLWPALSLKGVYELIGAQFPIELEEATDWSVGLRKRSDAPAGWLEIATGEDAPVLVIGADDQEARAKLGRLSALRPRAGITEPPASLARMREQPLRFTLKNSTVWSRNGAAMADEGPRIVSLAGPLSARLVADGRLEIGTFGILEENETLERQFQTAIRVDLEIQRVLAPRQTSVSPKGESAEFLPKVYQVGGADEANRQLLDAFLRAARKRPELLDEIAGVDLLYPEAGGLASESAGKEVFLIKTNLSTDSNPELRSAMLRELADDPDPVFARLSDRRDFMMLLLECSIVNSGGYYLYYETEEGGDLPVGELFADSRSSSFTVLISFEQASRELLPFHNVVVALPNDSTISPEGTGPTYQAEIAGKSHYEPAMPAGATGFELSRENPRDGYALPSASPSPGATREDVVAALAAQGIRPGHPEFDTSLAAAGEMDVEIAKLFNLIQFRIREGRGFHQSIWSLPLGPGRQSTDAATDSEIEHLLADPVAELPWDYQQTFIYYRFALGNFSDPDRAPNRYFGIGDPLEVDFRIVDNYGNTLLHDDDFPALRVPQLLYYDRLMAITDWPATGVNYVVEASESGPKFIVRVSFDVEAYPPGAGAVVAQQHLSALSQYNRIYDQLTDPNVAGAFRTSLIGSLEKSLNLDLLADFVETIRQFLRGERTEVGDLSLVFGLTEEELSAQTDEIFHLESSIRIFRTDHVAPDTVGKIDEAKEVITQIPAVVPEASTSVEGEDLGLQQVALFAEKFEAAFDRRLRVAVGTASAADRAQQPPDAAGAELWVVRIGAPTGIGIEIDPHQRHYYAPAPLHTSLQSETFLVREYISGEWSGGPEDYTEGERRFADVDLDVIARDFLAAVDAFLDPDLSVAVAKVDPDEFTRLMGLKGDLAGEIKQGVTTILAEDEPDREAREAAREAFFQRLLVSLSDSYKVDAITQVPARITHHLRPQQARLFGDIREVQGLEGTDADTTGNSFSSARLALTKVGEPTAAQGAEIQYLTFLFTAADPTEQSSYEARIGYQVSHLEHDFAPLNQAPGDPPRYMTSSWLKFVLPFGREDIALPVGEVNVPIPLRFYPEAPSLREQSAEPLYQQERWQRQGLEAGGESSVLEEVTQWSYGFAYDRPAAAQDTVIARVTFNSEQSEANSGALVGNRRAGEDREPVQSLFEGLARFAAEYPAIAHHFPAILAAAGASEDLDVARAVIRRFVDLVDGVVDGWRLHNRPHGLVQTLPLTKQVINIYQIRDYGERIEIDGSQETAWDPRWPEWPEIDGYRLTNPSGAPAHYRRETSAAQQERVLASEGFGDADRHRRFLLGGQSAISRENGMTSLKLVRNKFLQDHRETDERFIFETPWIGFPGPVTPRVIIEREISLAEFPGSTLPEKFSSFFKALFRVTAQSGSDREGPAASDTRLIKLTASFSRPQVSFHGGEKLWVQLPFTLTESYCFDLATDWDSNVVDSFVCRLGTALEKVFDGYGRPSSEGRLQFDLSLFADLADSKQLLVRLKQIVLPVGSEAGWWTCSERQKK
ncbi:MAG: hypothetical protein AAGD01_10920 [Acidobacteriota bacterium]